MSIFQTAAAQAAAAQAAQAVPMSHGDSVVVHTSQPDCVGVYVDAQQQNADAFALAQMLHDEQLAARGALMQQPMAVVITEEGPHHMTAGYGYSDPASLTVGQPFSPIVSPNTKVVDGRRNAVSASADGSYIVVG